jgi:hypothetical protein
MDVRTLARLHALGRVAVGASFVAAPRLAGRAWIGAAADSPGAQVALAAFGVRDAVIGVGAAWALGGGENAGPWMLAGVASDAVDLAATAGRRDHLPTIAALGSMSLAVSSIALGLWLRGAVR